MFENDPPAVSPRAHRHVTLVRVPSMSVTDAVSVSPPDSVPEIDAVPGSSTLVRLMVTAMVSSVVVFALPAASLLSRTFTVTVYAVFADSKLKSWVTPVLVFSWPLESISKDPASVPVSV